MNIYQNDKIVFIVSYKEDNKLKQIEFEDFEHAYNCAVDASEGTRFLDLRCMNELNDSGFRASLMKFKHASDKPEVIHGHYLRQLKSLGYDIRIGRH